MGQASRTRIMVDYWQQGQHATHQYKERLVGLVKPGMRLLHGGCGWDKNESSRPFKETCQVVGIDLDPRVKSLFHSEFHLASLSAIPFEGQSFDLVFLEYVLEHVEDPASAFREMTRVLKPGGRILILTPALYSYKSLAAYVTPQQFHVLMGRVRYGRGHEADMYPTLYRCNTARQFERLAEANHLHITAMNFINNGPTWFEKFPVLFAVFDGFHRIIGRWECFRQLRCALLVELQKSIHSY